MEKYSVKFVTIFIALICVAQIKARPSTNDWDDMSFYLPGPNGTSSLDEYPALELIEQVPPKRNESHYISAGQYYELNCSMTGLMTLSNIYWIRGDNVYDQVKLLRAQGELVLQTISDDNEKPMLSVVTSKYIINSPSKNDEGKYSCITLTPDNKVYVIATYVNVRERTENEMMDKKKHDLVITEYVESLVSTEGSSITLYCKVSDYYSKITWFKSKEPGKMHPLNVDRETLNLNSITWAKDQAEYTCVATSANGEARATTNLFIRF